MKKAAICILVAAAFQFAAAQQKKTIRQQQPASETKKIPQPETGLFGGANLNHLNYHNKTTTIQGQNTGFHAGVLYQKNLKPGILHTTFACIFTLRRQNS